jgi:hypothetical protein
MTPVIKYMHLRLPSDNGYINQYGGLTGAYKVHNGMVKEFSTAKCNLADRYNRQDGVMVSEDRLLAGIITRLPFEGIESEAFRTAVHYAWDINPKQAYRYSLGTRPFICSQPKSTTAGCDEDFEIFG